MADDEEEIVRYLFHLGYEYEEIIEMVSTRYDIHMSLGTLKRRLTKWNPSRKNVQYNINTVESAIRELLNGSNSLLGYLSIWHTIRLKGIAVPRIVVQELMKEIDPEGVKHRKRHKLRRREYYCPGPNGSWNAGGYDKLSLTASLSTVALMALAEKYYGCT